MKLIIEIPERVYKAALNDEFYIEEARNAIKNGIPFEEVLTEVRNDVSNYVYGCLKNAHD